MIDRRPIIQSYLDKIEDGWHVYKPAGPGDIDGRCIFQNPGDRKEATANLPVKWFEDGDDHLIRSEIARAVREAVVKK